MNLNLKTASQSDYAIVTAKQMDKYSFKKSSVMITIFLYTVTNNLFELRKCKKLRVLKSSHVRQNTRIFYNSNAGWRQNLRETTSIGLDSSVGRAPAC